MFRFGGKKIQGSAVLYEKWNEAPNGRASSGFYYFSNENEQFRPVAVRGYIISWQLI